MPWPIIVRYGPGLLKIGSNQLKKYMDKGAKPIKNPTSTQIKNAKTPNQIQKKRVRKKAEEHIDRVQEESKGTYNPKHGQPKGYRDIFEGDETGTSRFTELEKMRPMDDPMSQFDVKIRKKKGGSVRGKQRGMGIALRGGGIVSRSK